MTKTWRKLHVAARLKPIVRPMTNDERKRQNSAGDQFPAVHTPESYHHSVTERLGKPVKTIAEDGSSSTIAYQPQQASLGTEQSAA